ncbi:MAG: hypothetical protein GTN98_07750 [Woeseiaceae bacterium]|nr:hypothetical protein [Woeseiaceae bacterium]
MVDQRYDPSYIHEKDRIRGCPIGKIYEATPEELIEIKELSKSVAAAENLPQGA